MVGEPNTWWGSHTWWAAHIHGDLASKPASFGGAPPPAGPARPPTWPPTKAGRLAGQATMYVGRPPFMGSPTCLCRYQVSKYGIFCVCASPVLSGVQATRHLTILELRTIIKRPWITMDVRGCPWKSMDVQGFHGYPWMSMDCYYRQPGT